MTNVNGYFTGPHNPHPLTKYTLADIDATAASFVTDLDRLMTVWAEAVIAESRRDPDPTISDLPALDDLDREIEPPDADTSPEPADDVVKE